MAIIKKTYTIAIPEGAELFTRNKVDMARWIDGKGKKQVAPLTADGKRVRMQSNTYFAKYTTADGRTREVSTQCTTLDGARRKLAELRAVEEKVRSYVLTRADADAAEYSHSKLDDAIKKYKNHLEAAGRADSHTREVIRLLTRAAEECGWGRLRDLDGKRAARWLEGLRDVGLSEKKREDEEGVSNRTVNKYASYLQTFGGWLHRTGQVASNPFDTLPSWRTSDDRRHVRRAFTPEELAKFLAAAEARSVHDVTTIQTGPRKGQQGAKARKEVITAAQRLGRERALFWRLMAFTGLRHNEARSLTLADMVLDGDRPRVELCAKNAKNRKGAAIPLRADLVAMLCALLADRLQWEREAAQTQGKPIPAILGASAKLFPNAPASVRPFDADLTHAGIHKEDDRGRVLDIHSLRVTFGSMLSAAGVPLVTGMHLMRHSDPKLTAAVYCDAHLLDMPGAVAKLPNMGGMATAEAASGTDA